MSEAKVDMPPRTVDLQWREMCELRQQVMNLTAVVRSQREKITGLEEALAAKSKAASDIATERNAYWGTLHDVREENARLRRRIGELVETMQEMQEQP